MNIVQPIRSREIIEQIKMELLKNSSRDYTMFVIGINTGLRIGDILKLKVEDVKDKEHIKIHEQKTDKYKRFLVNKSLKKEIDKYIHQMKLSDYLFPSRKGVNKPISRVQAYRILNKVADKLGLDEIGTHTLRKTFGYWHYQKYKDVVMLQNIFNHTTQGVTLRYIGISQDIQDETIRDFFL